MMMIMSAGMGMGETPRKAMNEPFARNYVPTWALDHIKDFNAGSEIHLYLDNRTGTGFESKGSYLFGHFAMQIKMVPGDSAGTVTAFYLSSQSNVHDEIDFEFLGNRTGEPYILQTNVYTGGQGNKEQRIYLWFDPTQDFHTYSVLWNMHQIVFYVDNIPIRVFKNNKRLGVKFPFNQPMKIYSSLWNADDWATRGGLEKTDWSKAPFVAAYKGFNIDGCLITVDHKFCATHTQQHWWNQKDFQDLTRFEWRRVRWVRNRYTVYNYCTDRLRYPTVPPECRRNRDI
nr:probable xyloglucan endotransglucosylase/hydrolase protein B [Ipomoea batatas]